MKLLRWLLLSLFSSAILTPPALAQQDINIVGGTSPYIVIGRGLQWGGSGFGNLNNNFIFTPTGPDVGFCLYLSNNNPSSSHSVSVSVFQSGDPALKSFIGSQGKWNGVPTTTTFPISVLPNSVSGVNYKTSASANITVQFTGATTQGGSPDTVDVFAVQTTQSSCGALASNSVQGVYQNNTNVTNAQDFPVLIGGLTQPGSTSTAATMHIGNTGQGLLLDGGVCCQAFASGFQSNPAGQFTNFKNALNNSQEIEAVIDNMPLGFFGARGTAPGFTKTNFLEIASDQFWNTASQAPAWVVLGKVTNPGAGGTILSHFLTVGAAVNPAYKTLVLSCSAACELAVNRITARGTTCTTLTPQNIQIGNAGTVQAPVANDISENACTGSPTAATAMYDVSIGAGQTVTLDLSGFVNFHSSSSGSGFYVSSVAALTGVATASLTWVEQ